MVYAIGLIVGLIAFWLGMSGHYTPLLLSLGTISVMLSVILAARLDILDREGAPYFRFAGILLYLPWLIVEIIKSNITVARACLKADLDISPVLVKVGTQCETDLAKTLFANSITLTPGTVTVAVEERRLLVHALYEENAQPEAFVEMDQRALAAIDGEKGTV
ncbi:MAG: Na+/H+ antiporter subunit E [Pseudomonadota bacterium]